MPSEAFRATVSISEDAAPAQSGTDVSEGTLRAGATEYVMIGGITIPVEGVVDAFAGLSEDTDPSISSSEEYRSG